MSITETLVNGQLKPWPGPFAEVRSPVCLRATGTEEPQLLVIGGTPLMDGHAAIEALDSAAEAYGQGRGTWPSLSVGQRIEHVEQFLVEMRSHREAVVELLMFWLIK